MSKKKEKKEIDNLEDAINEIKQRFGEGSIMKLKEVKAVDIDAIPTGSISLDLALGVGGIPRGRVPIATKGTKQARRGTGGKTNPKL